MMEIQMINEICYRKSVMVLERLLRDGVITEEQFVLIDQLNIDTFSPILKQLSD